MKRAKKQHRGGRGQSQAGRVRIIAGTWRGRRLAVAEVPGLRPSADRLRETLFAWLTPWLPGARCLDLYAGSGALGLEAASRGAAEVVLIDRDHRAVETLKTNVATLGAETVRVINADARTWLAAADAQFDLIFLDPPFELESLDAVLAATLHHVVPRGWIYLEQPVARQHALPGTVQVYREKTFGAVRAMLLRKASPAGE